MSRPKTDARRDDRRVDAVARVRVGVGQAVGLEEAEAEARPPSRNTSWPGV